MGGFLSEITVFWNLQGNRVASKDFRLPRGWTVKEVPRRNSPRSIDKVLMTDKRNQQVSHVG